MSSALIELDETRSAALHRFLGSMLESGSVSVSVLLESIYYASEPELIATLRALAALDVADRQRVLAFATGLNGEAAKVVTHREAPALRQ